MSTLFTPEDQEQYRRVHCLYLPSELSSQHNKGSGFWPALLCVPLIPVLGSQTELVEATYIIRPCLFKKKKGGGTKWWCMPLVSTGSKRQVGLLSSRQTWSIECILGHPGLHRDTLSGKAQKERNVI